MIALPDSGSQTAVASCELRKGFVLPAAVAALVPPIPPLHLLGQQTLTQGGVPPPSSHDP